MKKYDGPKWQEIKPEVKNKFEEAGINSCEVRWEGCTGSYKLYRTFAHSLRRRRITTKEQMEEVLWACQHCHSILDARKEYETYAIVRKIISERITPVKSVYDGNKNTGGLATVFENQQYKAANATKRYRNKPQGKRVLPGAKRRPDDGVH